MSIFTDKQVEYLQRKGFTDYEIAEFDKSRSPDLFDNAAFKSLVKSRAKYVARKVKKGWTIGDVKLRVARWYLYATKHKPWDYFRDEYAKLTPKTDLDEKDFREYAKAHRDFRDKAKYGQLSPKQRRLGGYVI